MHIQTTTKEITTEASWSLMGANRMKHNKNSEMEVLWICNYENEEFNVTHYEMCLKIFPWFMENKEVPLIWIRMPDYRRRKLTRMEGFLSCLPEEAGFVLCFI